MGSDGRGIGGIEEAERLDGKLGVLTPDGGLVEATGTGATIVRAFINNTAVIHSLRSGSETSSCALFVALRNAISSWLAEDPTRVIHICWVPGHTDIGGNETSIHERRGRAWPLRDGRQKAQLQQSWQQLWSECGGHSAYRRLRLNPPSLKPGPHLGDLPRSMLGLWLQAKTGHGDFSGYHTRPHFNHPEAHLFCRCGKPKTRLHPLPAITQLFNTASGIARFAEYASLSKAFDCNKMA
ncbi:hypothetical protein V8E36_002788 [Tilletia maclaganii]